ncbi:WhiB family transcriptional regulator [Streptomyces sp. NPDC058758]|uniref:WhiB family transcriptional regulator n=2 Tax=unclassified Streptomyces TaxID=2593676 RepID=UPI00369D6AF6
MPVPAWGSRRGNGVWRGGDSVSGSWMSAGLCRAADADDLFVEGAAQNRAKALCGGCPVRAECLAYALDGRIEHGVWGGMTERERRALLKRRPTVRSWAGLFEAARLEHDAVARSSVRRSA